MFSTIIEPSAKGNPEPTPSTAWLVAVDKRHTCQNDVAAVSCRVRIEVSYRDTERTARSESGWEHGESVRDGVQEIEDQRDYDGGKFPRKARDRTRWVDGGGNEASARLLLGAERSGSSSQQWARPGVEVAAEACSTRPCRLVTDGHSAVGHSAETRFGFLTSRQVR